jgi:hypothetical protein
MKNSKTDPYKESKWERAIALRGRMVRAAVVASAILLTGHYAPAQAQEIQFGVDFNTVIPRGGFSENITNNGYGIGAQFLVRVAGSPLLVGADAGFVVYGSEKHKQIFSPSIPEFEVEVKTDNNIALTHLLLRAQPRSGAVRPYVDGLIGFKYLFTDTSITNDFNDEELASTTNFSDFTFSYGFGGGVQVRLAALGNNNEVLLDTKLRYLRGSRAEYLKEGSIRRDSGGVSFDVLSSRTDVVGFQVGVTFRF